MGYKRKRGSGQGTVVLDKTYARKTYAVKNKKAVKVKRIKKVKVGKVLRSKILKVIEKKEDFVRGSITNDYIGGKMYAKSRQQSVFVGAGIAQDYTNGWHFTLPMFYDVVNTLFGAQVTTFVAPDKYKLDQSNITDFPTKNLILEIVDSWSVYTFKNNTQHQVTIDLHIGVPKQRGCCLEWSDELIAQLGSDALGFDQEAYRTLDKAWQYSLDQDTSKGFCVPGFTPTNLAITNAVAIQNPNIEDLGRKPQFTKNLGNFYKIETVTLVLQPGQEVQHRLQGPRKTKVDFGAQWKGANFQNVQKYSRNVIGVVMNAPNSIASVLNSTGALSDATPGRYADQIDTQSAGFVINCERKDHFSVLMPEQTGFTTPAVYSNTNVFLAKRVPKTQYNIIDKTAIAPGELATKQVVDLSVMNPQQPVSAGPGTGT